MDERVLLEAPRGAWATAWLELLARWADLLDLRGWQIVLRVPAPEQAEAMRQAHWLAAIEVVDDGRRAQLWILPETTPSDEIALHELMHLVLSPWRKTGEFATGVPLEESQCWHLVRALRAARTGTRFPSPEGLSLEQAIAWTRWFTGLHENDWFIHVVPGREVRARTLYGQNGTGMGWGVFAARQIELSWPEEDGGFIWPCARLARELVRELFGIVLSPYRDGERTAREEQILRAVMGALEGLGFWALWEGICEHTGGAEW